MSQILARGQICGPTDQINLTIKFRDQNGSLINTDSFPKITINQPDGTILLAATSVGVTQISTGYYSYLFTVPYMPQYGVWVDSWVGYINGNRVTGSFEFIVNTTQLYQTNNLDGYVNLGDDPGFHYDQNSIRNINKILKVVKQRLNSSGMSESTDKFGNKIYQSCDIFSVDTLVTFIANSIAKFNEVPFFTFYTLDNDMFVNQFLNVLVEGAVLEALASKALLERGSEYDISDQGVSFKPATVSELLNTQYGALLTNYWERLKFIKASLRPGPLGLGEFNMNSGALNPALRNLSKLRARRLF